MYTFIHYPSDVAAILESGFSPITSSSMCSFFNGSGLKPLSGLVTPCSKVGSVEEQTPMAKASGIERSAGCEGLLRGLLGGEGLSLLLPGDSTRPPAHT